MKKIIFVLAVVCIALFSCSRESTISDSNINVSVSIKGIINDEINVDTKTDYSIVGNTASFMWKGSEEIDRLYTASNGNFGTITYSGTAGTEGLREITFEGNEIPSDAIEDLGYAVYPKKGASNNAGLDKWSNGCWFQLKETINYDKDAALANIVPMVGHLEGGKFVFNVATGIICVRITNIPSSATKLTISSSSQYLSGGFRYTSSSESSVTYSSELGNIYNNGFQLSSPKSSGDNAKTKSFSFSSLDPAKEYAFYFPIPVGVITGGLTITLYNGSTELYSAKTSQDVESVRGTITRLPLITAGTIGTASVSGDYNSPIASFTLNNATSIKYAVSTSSTASLAGLTQTVVTSSTDVDLSSLITTTGTYYLYYQSYRGTAKFGAEMKSSMFLYASNDVSQLAGKYLINNNSLYGFDIEAIVPADSDGNNIKITKYYTNATSYSGATGSCKGVYNPTNGTITIPCCQVLTKDTNNYCLIGFSGNVSKSDYNTYDDNFKLTITAVENNAGLKFLCNKICVTPSSFVNTTNQTFRSDGQHFTSDGSGSGGSVFLYKAN